MTGVHKPFQLQGHVLRIQSMLLDIVDAPLLLVPTGCICVACRVNIQVALVVDCV
jgi:hypothetical protein